MTYKNKLNKTIQQHGVTTQNRRAAAAALAEAAAASGLRAGAEHLGGEGLLPVEWY